MFVFFQSGTITTGNRNIFKDGKMKKHNGIEQMYFIDPKLGNDAVAALKTDTKNKLHSNYSVKVKVKRGKKKKKERKTETERWDGRRPMTRSECD